MAKIIRLAACVILLVAGCQQGGSRFQVVDLEVNYESEPMVVETGQPQFSWRMESGDGRGQQSAYELTVRSESGETLWTSDRVAVPDSIGIVYEGQPLAPLSRYEWDVRVWNASGDSAVSTSTFETGFMQPDQRAWSGAQWIGGGQNDAVFHANYLSVFALSFAVQLDEESGSDRAALLLGGNDFRLLDKNLNIQQVENGPDESFVGLELDTSGLASDSGQAHLNVYRVGYAPGDNASQPLARLPIPTSIVDINNRYAPHTIYLESVFGVFNISVDGRDAEHRVTPVDPRRPAFGSQGLNVNPIGSGGNYIAFPVLGDIGFWIRQGQVAQFSNIEIRHLRSPGNILFAAGGGEGQPSPEIFQDAAASGRVRRLHDGGYEVILGDEEFVYLADPSRDGVPMLRREFELDDKPIRKARLYATARGVYEVHINGERVGKDYFAPGLTQYDKHHSYQAYDVSGLLKSGTGNTIGALLGEGWWSGNITYSGTNWNYFGDRQSLLARLVVTYEDGTSTEIVSEPDTWRVFHGGPIRYGSFFQGEIYDASLESTVEGWANSDFDDSEWLPAQVVSLANSAFVGNPEQDTNNQLITGYEGMQLIGHPGNEPQIIETLQATAVREVRPGVFVYDMGQNMVGFPRIHLANAREGRPVVLRYSEVLYPDLPEHEGLVGTLMMENLRAALVHDIYYPGGGDEVIQPRFTFHGYRYIEISGIDEPLPLQSVEGLVVSSVTNLASDFETSNSLVNSLWKNITWSFRSNFLSIPTDTPARNERMGWNGDLSVFSRTANYLAHIDPFITRHMQAMRDLQSKDGRFPDVAPVGGGFGGTLWGSAGIIVPWETYLQYGDMDLLRDHYPAMARYVEYLLTRTDSSSGVLLEGPLGDWLSPEGNRNDNSLLWEAYFVHSLDIVASTAELLGLSEDAAHFRGLHDQRKAFFNETYVNAESGKTVSSGVAMGGFGGPARIDEEKRGTIVDTQASYAVPIAMGIFSDANLPLAEQHLAEAIERENVDDGGALRPPYSLMTGFIGTASLPQALSMSGRDDLAYRLLQQTSYPSWLYSVVNGATTIWERLNSYTVEAGFGGNNSMNSFNHYAFGAVGAWMMSYALGIQRLEESPAFREFVLAPRPDPTGQMTWARGHYDSMYGRIESGWSVEGTDIHYRFTVPENTTAALHLPADETSSISTTSDALFVGQDGSTRTYSLGPGEHQFTVSLSE